MAVQNLSILWYFFYVFAPHDDVSRLEKVEYTLEYGILHCELKKILFFVIIYFK